MKRTLNALISLTLSMSMLFSGSLQVFADDSAEQPETEQIQETTESAPEPMVIEEPEPVQEEAPVELIEQEQPVVESTPEPIESTPVPEETIVPVPVEEEIVQEEAPVLEEQVPAEEEQMEPVETAAIVEEILPEETVVDEEEPVRTPEPVATEEPMTTEVLEEEEIVNMPAQSFRGETSEVYVYASVNKDVFPEGTTMSVTPVAKDVALQIVNASSTDENREYVDAVAVDITFYFNGNEIQPENQNGVRVSIIAKSSVEGTEHEVVHIAENDAEVVSTASAKTASFDATSFSIYAIVGSENGVARRTYNFYIGSNLYFTSILINNDTLELPVPPLDANERFDGWFNEGTQLYGGTITDIGTTDETINATAKITKVYTATFHKQNGDILTAETVEAGQTVKTDKTLEHAADEAVTGWTTTQDGTTPVAETITMTSDMDLYPIIEKVVWVRFHANDDTSKTKASYTAPVYTKKGGTITSPDSPTRSGYTFVGWSTNPDSDTANYNFSSAVNGDMDLYAVWKGKKTTYRVIYWQENADDDGYSVAESKVESAYAGKTITKATEKSFSGFTKNTTLTDRSVKVEGDGSTVFNVYYDRNQYEIKFYQYTEGYWNTYWNGHKYKKEWIKGEWKEINELKITAKYGANISDQWPSKVSTEYSSLWATSHSESDPQGPYQSGIETMPIGGNEFYKMNKEGYEFRSIYMVMDPVSGKYVEHHTDVFYSKQTLSVTEEDRYDITGYTINEDASPKNGDEFVWVGGFSEHYELTFKYYINKHNVSFYDGAKSLKNQTFYYNQDLSSLSSYKLEDKPNYTFGGWYTNDQLVGDPYDFAGKKMLDSNLVFYAKWLPKTANVEFNADGGTPEPETQTVTIGTTSSRPAQDPEKSGYIFGGWTLENDPFNFDTAIENDITLKAKWISAAGITVVYDAENAPVDSSRYQTGASYTVKNWTSMIDDFTGWQINGTGTIYTAGDTFVINADDAIDSVITLKPTSKNIDYRTELTYMPGNGNGTESQVKEIKNNASIKIKSLEDLGFTAPSEDYYFEGFTDGTNTYQPGETVGINKIGTNTLTAVWCEKEEVEITITGNSNTFTYDGTAKTVSGYTTTTLPTGVTITVNTEPSRIETNAGTYAVEVNAGQFNITNTNHKIKLEVKYVDGQLIINKAATAEIKITGQSKTETYNGSEQSVSGFETEAPAGVTVTLNDESKAIAKGINAGTYNMTMAESDFTVHADNYDSYTITIVNGTLTITPTEVEKVVTITGNSDTMVYNKGEQSVTGYTTDATSDITVALKNESKAVAKGTNVGTYSMGLTADDFTATSANYSNIKLVVTDGQLTITPITEETEVKVFGNTAELVYNKSEQSITGFQLADGTDTTITVELTAGKEAVAKGTNAGTYYMGLTAEDFTATSANYSNIKVEVTDGQLMITPIMEEIQIDITGNKKTVYYDGTQQSVEGYEVGTTPASVTVELKSDATAIAGGTYVGKYAMNLSSDSFIATSVNYTNIKLNVVDGELEILDRPNDQKYDLHITIGKGGETYNGKDQTVGIDLNHDGFAIPVDSIEYEEPTMIAALFSLFKSPETRGTSTFNVYLTVKDDLTKKDAGYYEEAVDAEYKLVDEEGNEVTDQFNVTFDPMVLEIDKRDVTLTSQSGSRKVNGTAYTLPSVTVGGDGFVDGEVSNIRATGSITNAGSVKNSITWDKEAEYKDDNYNITLVEGTLTLTANSTPVPTPDPKPTPYTPEPYTPETGTTRPYTPMTGIRTRPYTPSTEDPLNITNWILWMFGSLAIAGAAAIALNRKEH